MEEAIVAVHLAAWGIADNKTRNEELKLTYYQKNGPRRLALEGRLFI